MAAARTVPGASAPPPLTKAQRRAAAQAAQGPSAASSLATKGQDPNAVVVDVPKHKVRSVTSCSVPSCLLVWRERFHSSRGGWPHAQDDSSSGRPDKAAYDAGKLGHSLLCCAAS